MRNWIRLISARTICSCRLSMQAIYIRCEVILILCVLVSPRSRCKIGDEVALIHHQLTLELLRRDRIEMLFVAAHESSFGPRRASRSGRSISVGKADVPEPGHDFRF